MDKRTDSLCPQSDRARHKDTPNAKFSCHLDIVDHNIDLMRKRFQEKICARRIPSKAHKCPGLARYITERGSSVGLVLLTLKECEAFAEEGFQNIYFANQVATEDEIKKLNLSFS